MAFYLCFFKQQQYFELTFYLEIEDVVSLIIELELFPSLLEIKDGKDEKIPELVAELFKKYPVLYDHVVIMSFFPNQLVR